MSDLDNVITALNLEYGAHRRYDYQVEHSPYPHLNMVLEGVGRTEGDHMDTMLAYIRARQTAEPEQGRGFTTMLMHLRLNMEFERVALDAYARFARDADDPALKATFQQLSRAEAGHLKLFKSLIERIEANEYPAILYCPVCGWEIDFGLNPAEGAVIRCPQCKADVRLELREGDFVATG
jgi:rubrerythrin